MPGEVTEFRIEVPDVELEDLRARNSTPGGTPRPRGALPDGAPPGYAQRVVSGQRRGGREGVRVIEERASRLVERLRERRVLAHVAPSGVFQFGIRVVIPDGREVIWDNDGAAALEAQILQDGVLVGYVPTVPGSEDFDDDAVVDYIARMRYDDFA
jgi:hypothetical protein